MPFRFSLRSRVGLFALLFAFPLPLYAQDFTSLVIKFFTLVVDPLIPILITIAVVVFIVGMIRLIANAENAERRKQGRQMMVWSVVALFVMVSVWGIVQVLQNTFFAGGAPHGPIFPPTWP